jgi:hypothetical protein
MSATDHLSGHQFFAMTPQKVVGAKMRARAALDQAHAANKAGQPATASAHLREAAVQRAKLVAGDERGDGRHTTWSWGDMRNDRVLP